VADVVTNQAKAPKDEREISEQEKAQAKTWNDKIKAAKKRQEKTALKAENLKKLREYVNGKQHDDGSPGLVRTNLIYATIASMLPYLYAKNPDISVTPTESVEPQGYAAIKKFCGTLEAVLHRMFVAEGKLKKRMKSNVRSAQTTGLGWVKVLYQQDLDTDSLMQNRVNDTQDNVRRVESLTKDVADNATAADAEAKQGELEQTLNGLESQSEVTVANGIVIDRVMSENLLILDESLRDFDMYVEARALGECIWFTKETYKETFGEDAPASVTYFKQPNRDNITSDGYTNQWIAVYEIWDKDAQTVYTVAEGSDRFCREPYQPDTVGERWYPYFALAFNPVDGQFEPLSDVELLKELQDEYNTTRTNYAEHRKENLPVRVFRKGGGLRKTISSALANRKINEFVGVEGDPSRPLTDDIAVFPNTPLDVANYDVTPIRNDIDMVSGMGDASRSNLIKAKTATEAEIMREGLQSRTAERQDTIEDVLQEMAQYVAEILLQKLTKQQAQRIAGPGASWPQLSKDEIFDLVRIEIRAGSTVRPNKAKERQQWIELLPSFQKMVTTIMELRQEGHADLARSLTEMAKETLKRFDERLDLDVFIPVNADDPQAAQQQALQELQQKLEQLTQENEELKVAADKNATDLAIAKMDNETQLDIAREKNAPQTVPDVATPLQMAFDGDAAAAGAPMAAVPAPEPAAPPAPPVQVFDSSHAAGFAPIVESIVKTMQDHHAQSTASQAALAQAIAALQQSIAQPKRRTPMRGKDGRIEYIDEAPIHAPPAATQ
jgi:hypothetical protein